MRRASIKECNLGSHVENIIDEVLGMLNEEDAKYDVIDFTFNGAKVELTKNDSVESALEQFHENFDIHAEKMYKQYSKG